VVVGGLQVQVEGGRQALVLLVGGDRVEPQVGCGCGCCNRDQKALSLCILIA